MEKQTAGIKGLLDIAPKFAEFNNEYFKWVCEPVSDEEYDKLK